MVTDPHVSALLTWADSQLSRSVPACGPPEPGGRIATLAQTFALDRPDLALWGLALAGTAWTQGARDAGTPRAHRPGLPLRTLFDVWGGTVLDALDARARLSAEGRLRRHGLLQLGDDVVLVPEDVLGWIAHQPRAWPSWATPWPLSPRPCPPVPPRGALWLVGGTSGQRAAHASAMAAAHGLNGLLRLRTPPDDASLTPVLRDARIDGLLVLLELDAERLAAPSTLTSLRHHDAPLALSGPTPAGFAAASEGRAITRVDVSPPELTERAAVWAAAGATPAAAHQLAREAPELDGPQILATAADLPAPRDILALREAAQRARLPARAPHATWITPRARWSDLALDPTTQARLRDLVEGTRARDAAREAGAVPTTAATRTGLRLLLTGPPGTGKTLTAEVIAGALDHALLRVDLSLLLSKWLGETESRLRAILDAADGCAATVLFDEGDALLARRDGEGPGPRAAAQAAAYLLQRFEHHRGALVVTTNLPQSLDPAFERRFDDVIHLGIPDRATRRALWGAALPATPHRGDDIDLDHLAAFPLAGGHILPAAERAALTAWQAQRPVSHADVLRAIARSLERRRERVRPADFRGWWPLVSAEVRGS